MNRRYIYDHFAGQGWCVDTKGDYYGMRDTIDTLNDYYEDFQKLEKELAEVKERYRLRPVDEIPETGNYLVQLQNIYSGDISFATTSYGKSWPEWAPMMGFKITHWMLLPQPEGGQGE